MSRSCIAHETSVRCDTWIGHAHDRVLWTARRRCSRSCRRATSRTGTRARRPSSLPASQAAGEPGPRGQRLLPCLEFSMQTCIGDPASQADRVLARYDSSPLRDHPRQAGQSSCTATVKTGQLAKHTCCICWALRCHGVRPCNSASDQVQEFMHDAMLHASVLDDTIRTQVREDD